MILKLHWWRLCECLQISPTFVERSCISNRCPNFTGSLALLTDGGRTPVPKRVLCPGISGRPWKGKNKFAPNLSFWGLPSCVKMTATAVLPVPCGTCVSMSKCLCLCSQHSQPGRSQSFADRCLRLERSFSHSLWQSLSLSLEQPSSSPEYQASVAFPTKAAPPAFSSTLLCQSSKIQRDYSHSTPSLVHIYPTPPLCAPAIENKSFCFSLKQNLLGISVYAHRGMALEVTGSPARWLSRLQDAYSQLELS